MPHTDKVFKKPFMDIHKLINCASTPIFKT